MNSDPILRRIWRVQGKLARKAGYDPKTYAGNAEKAVREIEKRYGFKFKYADISQPSVRPLQIAEARTEYAEARTEYKVKRRTRA